MFTIRRETELFLHTGWGNWIHNYDNDWLFICSKTSVTFKYIRFVCLCSWTNANIFK